MGFSSGSVHHLTWLGRDGHVPPRARVLDFGSQNFYGDLSEEAGRAFLAAFGRETHYKPELFANGEKIEALMEALGFDYIAFDMYSAGRTRKFDFNYDRLSFFQRGKFDLVMNLGTSEHVANQFNLFKTAHDAMKVGGVLFNNVPFFGGPDHGLFNYHPKFFVTLAANNAYAPLYFDFSEPFKSQYWDTYNEIDAAYGGAAWKDKYIGLAMMNAILKKTTAGRFQPPTDALLAGDISVAPPTMNMMVSAIRPAKSR